MLWEACLLWEAILLRLCSDLVYCLLTLGDVYSNSQRKSCYFTLSLPEAILHPVVFHLRI